MMLPLKIHFSIFISAFKFLGIKFLGIELSQGERWGGERRGGEVSCRSSADCAGIPQWQRSGQNRWKCQQGNHWEDGD